MLLILYLCKKHKLLIRLLFGVVPHLRCFVVFLQFKPFFKSIGHIVAVRNQKLIIMRQFNLTDSLSSEKAGPPLPRRCFWMRMALVVLLAVFAVATMQAADYGIVINGYSVWEKKLQRPLWNQGCDRKREVRSCNKNSDTRKCHHNGNRK